MTLLRPTRFSRRGTAPVGGERICGPPVRQVPSGMAAKSKSSSPKLSIEPRIRINYGRGVGFGPGKAELLAHIDLTGSISEAAKAMEMSYMRAWTLVKSMEKGFVEPLVLKVRGGNARGGAALSETGRSVLALYREMEAESTEAMRGAGERFARLLD